MKLKFIVFVLVSALLAYSGYWVFLSMNTGVYIDRAKAGLEDRGVSFSYDDYSVSGFPYRLVLDFQNPEMIFANGPVSLKMDAGGLEAIIQPWKFDHIILFPEQAEAILRINGEEAGEVIFRPAKTSISLAGIKTGQYRLSMVMEKVRVVSSVEFPFPEEFQAFSAHLRKNPQPEMTQGELFEPRLLEIVLEGDMEGQKSFSFGSSFRGREVPEISESGLRNWQQGGGTFEIENFEYTDGQGRLEAQGSMSLDEELRPLGSIGLKADSAKMLLTFFKAARVIKNPEADLISAFLETLPPPRETGFQVSLGLVFQDGYLMLGPVQLKKFGPLIQEESPERP